MARQLKFEFERDLRELEVYLVLELEFGSAIGSQTIELLRDVRRALELQA